MPKSWADYDAVYGTPDSISVATAAPPPQAKSWDDYDAVYGTPAPEITAPPGLPAAGAGSDWLYNPPAPPEILPVSRTKAEDYPSLEKPRDNSPVGDINAAVYPVRFPSGTAAPATHVTLPPDLETRFQQWYRQYASTNNLDLNPDDPNHHYDYRAYWQANQKEPDRFFPSRDPEDGNRMHLPSEFKDADHPNRFVQINGQLWDTLKDQPAPADQQPSVSPALDFGDYAATQAPGAPPITPTTLDPLVARGVAGILQGGESLVADIGATAELAGDLQTIADPNKRTGALLQYIGKGLREGGTKASKDLGDSLGPAGGMVLWGKGKETVTSEEVVQNLAQVMLPLMTIAVSAGATTPAIARGAVAPAAAVLRGTSVGRQVGFLLERMFPRLAVKTAGGIDPILTMAASGTANGLTNAIYGGVVQYKKAKDEGKSEEEALGQASTAAALNLATAATAISGAIPGQRLPARLLIGTIQGGLENGYRDLAGRVASGEPVGFDKAAQLSVLTGMILGGAMTVPRQRATDRVAGTTGAFRENIQREQAARAQAEALLTKHGGGFDAAVADLNLPKPGSGAPEPAPAPAPATGLPTPEELSVLSDALSRSSIPAAQQQKMKTGAARSREVYDRMLSAARQRQKPEEPPVEKPAVVEEPKAEEKPPEILQPPVALPAPEEAVAPPKAEELETEKKPWAAPDWKGTRPGERYEVLVPDGGGGRQEVEIVTPAQDNQHTARVKVVSGPDPSLVRRRDWVYPVGEETYIDETYLSPIRRQSAPPPPAPEQPTATPERSDRAQTWQKAVAEAEQPATLDDALRSIATDTGLSSDEKASLVEAASLKRQELVRRQRQEAPAAIAPPPVVEPPAPEPASGLRQAEEPAPTTVEPATKAEPIVNRGVLFYDTAAKEDYTKRFPDHVTAVSAVLDERPVATSVYMSPPGGARGGSKALGYVNGEQGVIQLVPERVDALAKQLAAAHGVSKEVALKELYSQIIEHEDVHVQQWRAGEIPPGRVSRNHPIEVAAYTRGSTGAAIAKILEQKTTVEPSPASETPAKSEPVAEVSPAPVQPPAPALFRKDPLLKRWVLEIGAPAAVGRPTSARLQAAGWQWNPKRGDAGLWVAPARLSLAAKALGEEFAAGLPTPVSPPTAVTTTPAGQMGRREPDRLTLAQVARGQLARSEMRRIIDMMGKPDSPRQVRDLRSYTRGAGVTMEDFISEALADPNHGAVLRAHGITGVEDAEKLATALFNPEVARRQIPVSQRAMNSTATAAESARAEAGTQWLRETLVETKALREKLAGITDQDALDGFTNEYVDALGKAGAIGWTPKKVETQTRAVLDAVRSRSRELAAAKAAPPAVQAPVPVVEPVAAAPESPSPAPESGPTPVAAVSMPVAKEPAVESKPVPPPAVGRELWEMTRGEVLSQPKSGYLRARKEAGGYKLYHGSTRNLIEETAAKIYKTPTEAKNDYLLIRHRAAVEEALKSGQPVPEAVRDEYPSLVEGIGEPAVPAPEAVPAAVEPPPVPEPAPAPAPAPASDKAAALVESYRDGSRQLTGEDVAALDADLLPAFVEEAQRRLAEVKEGLASLDSRDDMPQSLIDIHKQLTGEMIRDLNRQIRAAESRLSPSGDEAPEPAAAIIEAPVNADERLQEKVRQAGNMFGDMADDLRKNRDAQEAFLRDKGVVGGLEEAGKLPQARKDELSAEWATVKDSYLSPAPASPAFSLEQQSAVEPARKPKLEDQAIPGLLPRAQLPTTAKPATGAGLEGTGLEQAQAPASVEQGLFEGPEAEAARLAAEADIRSAGQEPEAGPPGVREVPGAGYEQPGPVFYSAVLRAAEGLPQAKGTSEQMLAMLKKTPGVKQDELNWLGLEPWLSEQKGPVTREQIAGFVRQNQVQVQEVVKGERRPLTEAESVERTRLGLKRKLTPSEKARYDELTTIELGTPTRFPNFILPGGENYREMFVTVPDGRSFREIAANKVVDAASTSWDAGKEAEKKYGMTYAEALKERSVTASRQMGKVWNDGHADYADIDNPVVRIRFNERTDAEGRRVLFIEEIQEPQKAQLAKAPAWVAKYGNEIGMKRMLRWAVENGFDAVAWTTGEQQAERYDLSKQVDRIDILRSENDLYSISVFPPGQDLGNEIARNLTIDKVAEYVGKDLAEKASQQKPGYHRYSGLDLKVGGEGLKNFYDRILPNFVNKYAKKWGAKVGETRVLRDMQAWTPYVTRLEESLEEARQDPSATPEEIAAGERDLADAKRRDAEGYTVHAVPITDAMRQSVLGGQALMERGRSYDAVTRLQEILRREGYRLPEMEVPNGAFEVQLGNTPVVVYKNPTRSDFRAISDRYRTEYPGSGRRDDPTSRTTRDAQGNTYAWMAGDGTHQAIEGALLAQHGIEAKQTMPVSGAPEAGGRITEGGASGETAMAEGSGRLGGDVRPGVRGMGDAPVRELRQRTPTGAADDTRDPDAARGENRGGSTEIPEEQDPLRVDRRVRTATGETNLLASGATPRTPPFRDAAKTDRRTTGYIDLQGKSLADHHDTAAAGQVFRDPKVEHLRFLYVGKNSNRSLGYESFTSRMPASVTDPLLAGLTEKELTGYWENNGPIEQQLIRNRQRMAERVNRLSKRYGEPVEIWVLHNHPTGRSLPSGDDLQFHKRLLAKLPTLKFRGHVIINTNEYSVVHNNGESETYNLETGKQLLGLTTTAEGTAKRVALNRAQDPTFEVLKQQAGDFYLKPTSSPRQVAQIGVEAKTPANYVSLIYSDSNQQVVGHELVPVNFFKSKDFSGFLRNRMPDMGAAHIYAYYDEGGEGEVVFKRGKDLVGEGRLTDVVMPGSLAILSVRESGMYREPRNLESVHRTAESGTGYNPDQPDSFDPDNPEHIDQLLREVLSPEAPASPATGTAGPPAKPPAGGPPVAGEEEGPDPRRQHLMQAVAKMVDAEDAGPVPADDPNDAFAELKRKDSETRRKVGDTGKLLAEWGPEGSFAEKLQKEKFTGRHAMARTAANLTYNDIDTIVQMIQGQEQLRGQLLDPSRDPRDGMEQYAMIEGEQMNYAQTLDYAIKRGLLSTKEAPTTEDVYKSRITIEQEADLNAYLKYRSFITRENSLVAKHNRQVQQAKDEWTRNTERELKKQGMDQLDLKREMGDLSAKEFAKDKYQPLDITTLNPDGVTAKMAQAKLDEKRKQIGETNFARLVRAEKNIARYWRLLLKQSIGGIISREQYDQLIAEQKAHGDYLGPFAVAEHLMERLVKEGRMPSSFDVAYQDQLMQRKGTTKEVLPMTDASFRKTFAWVGLNARNRVMQQLYDLRNQHDDYKDLIRDLPTRFDGREQVAADPASLGWHGFTAMSFMRDGKRVDFAMPDEFAAVMLALDKRQQSVLLKSMSVMGNWLRQGATGLNPTFGIAQVPSDFQTQLLAADSPVTLKDWRLLWNGFSTGLWQVGLQLPGSTRETQRRLRLMRSAGAAYTGYHAQGRPMQSGRELLLGYTGARKAAWQDARAEADAWKRTLGSLKVIGGVALDMPGKTLGLLSAATEHAQRQAVFEKNVIAPHFDRLKAIWATLPEEAKTTGGRTLEQVRSDLIAYREANPEAGKDWHLAPTKDEIVLGGRNGRNALINFNKGGTAMRTLTQMTPFMMSRVGATRTFVEGAKKNPGRALALGMAYMILEASTAVLGWQLFGHLMRDLDPQERKDRFIIPLGTDTDFRGDEHLMHLRIRKDTLGQLVTTPVRSFIDYLYTERPEAAAAFAEMISAVSPVDFAYEGDVPKMIGRAVMVTTPPVVRAFAEVSAGERGYDYYRQRELMTESEAARQPGDRYNAYTTATSRWLGGVLDVSPIKLDHLAQGLFGSIGPDFLRIPEVGNYFVRLSGRLGAGPKLPETLSSTEELGTIPIIRGFFSVRGGNERRLAHRALDEAQLAIGSWMFGNQKRAKEVLEGWSTFDAARKQAVLQEFNSDPNKRKILEGLVKRQEATGNDAVVARLKSFGEENGARALALSYLFNEYLITGSARTAFLTKLATTQPPVLTPTVVAQLFQLIKSGAIAPAVAGPMSRSTPKPAPKEPAQLRPSIFSAP